MLADWHALSPTHFYPALFVLKVLMFAENGVAGSFIVNDIRWGGVAQNGANSVPQSGIYQAGI